MNKLLHYFKTCCNKALILSLSDNGRIDFHEFHAFMLAEMSKIQDDEFMQQEDVVRAAFKTFDKDGNGFIDAKELRYCVLLFHNQFNKKLDSKLEC